MKTKFYWVALLASAALIAQAQAGGYHGGGGGNFAAPAHTVPGHVATPGFHSAPIPNFGGGRFVAPGQRFSSIGVRSPNSFRQHYINSSGGAAIGTRPFTLGNFNRSSRLTRFENRGNRLGQITNPTGEGTGAIRNQTGGNRPTRFGNNRHDRLAQSGNGVGEHNGAVRNHDSQVRNGNNLPANWRNHIAGRRSADWHRDWDRHRDHWWNGHRCRFVNGEWFIFDFGFPWYPYGYPYDYYAYDYYPYQYDPGVYEGDGGDYYAQGTYDSSDQSTDSTVAAAQEQLARRNYYRGEIDGIVGPETRRAITRFQGDHGMRVTGYLTNDTLDALGLQRVASN